MQAFGVDIGGTGIKGGPVHLGSGTLSAQRYEIATPHPADPSSVVEGVRKVVEHFGWPGPVGVAFPGVVIDGVTRSAANLDPRWIGLDAAELISRRLRTQIALLNDADAAGMAEMTYGAGRTQWGRAGWSWASGRGPTIVLTLGTGIGSAVFVDGVLVPNTELGHLELHGHDAERRASAKAREDGDLSWSRWARGLETYLTHLEGLFSPGLFIIGGGISREARMFLPLLGRVTTPIVPAELHNDAGIVGAAMAAEDL
ncbi:polyphosphate--glucose phosphotransferase [Actinacidiphila rubida]|uniref:Polyphosphate glucokinase n=1 Tax=Actinacidiphila rubida TaxID=310780 RepID=A0A1H8PYI5_9ACTN|nr:ROK family protein [Actinacidiphila rubida]SEO46717.1 polyphosphate glucokinase [Actinacidiphila rubida]